MNHRTQLPLLLLFAVATPAVAQSPKYVPPPPPRKNAEVEVRFKYLLPPQISFSGLGSISMLPNYETSSDILKGTERSIAYDDGFLAQDYVSTSLVNGGGDGTETIPSPNKDATAYFGYVSESQVDPNDPSVLLFHRYSADAQSLGDISANTSGSTGWEINYTKYANAKRRLGLQFGFSFNGFDSRFNDRIAADLYVQEFHHRMANGDTVPPLPGTENSDGTVTTSPYQGDLLRDAVASGDLLQWATVADTTTEEVIPEGATVFSRADLRSSVYNFRAGPTYKLSLGRRIGFQLGAGLSAIYYQGQFSAYEYLLDPTSQLELSRPLTTTDANEWQVAGYLDASAQYRINPWVSVFSGMQVQSGSNYSQANEDRHANVDFRSQVYVHAGLGIRF